MFQISAMINWKTEFEGFKTSRRKHNEEHNKSLSNIFFFKPAALIKFCFPIFGWKDTYSICTKISFQAYFCRIYFFLNSPSPPLESNNNIVRFQI